MHRLLRLPAACAVALAAACATGTPSALAGSYPVDADTVNDIAGWTAVTDTGFFPCTYRSRPGPCADGDVPNPTRLRIFLKGSVAANSVGLWRWDAPATTTIIAGTVRVNYHVTANTRAFMKAALRSESYSSQPQLDVVTTDGTSTWTIPSGKQGFAIFLKALADVNAQDKWQNMIRVDEIHLTLRDDVAPAVSLGGQLASGEWLSSAQPVCVDVTATDDGAGVARTELLGPAGELLASDDVAHHAGLHPGLVEYAEPLCVAPVALPDGQHSLSVRVVDGAGEQRVVSFGVRIDTHAPSAGSTQPLGSTIDRQPQVGFTVDPGPSGLAAFAASLDGVPMTVTDTTASITPQTDLAFGEHTVTWTASDLAGNSRDGFWTFEVVDDRPPVLTDPLPVPGSSSEERRQSIGFHVTDAGIGVQASTLRVLLDGLDVAPFGTFDAATGSFQYLPSSDLAFGDHEVRVLVSDRSGNAMAPEIWHFSVADVTPPVVGDVRPDDGAAGSDRTPNISFTALDAGIGVDAASVVLRLDGSDVSSLGSWQDGRFSFQPSTALAFGVHEAVASVSDRAGNRAEELRWSFTIRDETPPVIFGRLPAAGSTVAGATPIGFDVSDAGMGVDPASIAVVVDGSDVTAWGSYSAGSFRYSPGDLGAGVHTISATAADRAGNVTGPVMWQFAVADPARLELALQSAPAGLVYGQHGTILAHAAADGQALAGAEVRVSTKPAGSASFGPSRVLVTSATGVVRWDVAPSRTTSFRLELVAGSGAVVTRRIAVHQRVTIFASTTRLRRGSPLRLSGTVLPRRGGAHVALQMLTGRGWVTVSTPRLDARSAYATTVVPRVRGRYILRTVIGRSTANAAGVSRSVTVTVR